MLCKVVLPPNEIHVLKTIPTTIEDLRKVIQQRFPEQLSKTFSLKYEDVDKDLIILSTNEDLETAVDTAKTENLKNLRVIVVSEENVPNTTNPQEDQPKPITKRPPERKNSFIEEVIRDTFQSIPLTESITDLDDNKNTATPHSSMHKGSLMASKNPWEELTVQSENVSMHCSPDKDSKVNARSKLSYQKWKSLDNNSSQDEDSLKENFFNQGQMHKMNDVIDNFVVACVNDKLKGFLTEAIFNVTGQARNKPELYDSASSPFGMRLSSKRCKELASNDSVVCTECNGKIKDVRYSCLNCKCYNCCEICEEKANHPCPLLKIKANTRMGDSSYFGADTLGQSTKTLGRKGSLQMKSTSGDFGGLVATNRSSERANLMRQSNLVRTSTITCIRSDTPSGFSKSSFYTSNPISKSNRGSPKNTPLEICDVRDMFKRYKVSVIKEPLYDVIRVKSLNNYNMNFTIKNTGTNKWCDDVNLVCTQGIHKSEQLKIPGLDVGQDYEVNLNLRAPVDCGTYLSQWQFYYYEDNKHNSFGRPVYVEIEVSEYDGTGMSQSLFNAGNISNEKVDPHKEKEIERKRKYSESLEEDKRLIRDMKCTEQTLNFARQLNDMFRGEIRDKVEFIHSCEFTDINDLVSAYLDRLSQSCKRRANNNPIQRPNSVAL